MEVWVKLGGDPTLPWWVRFGFSIFHFTGVPNDIEAEFRKIFPKLKPLKISMPMKVFPDEIKCCACQRSHLPVQSSLEETLAQTHVHSSLVLDNGVVFLLDRKCAEKIKKYLDERYGSGTTCAPSGC